MRRKLLSATLLILMTLSLGTNIAYAALSVSTNKFTYIIGESVAITVSGASATSKLQVQVNNPSGNPVDVWETTVSTVGSYSFSWKTSDSLSVGLHKIYVKDSVTGQLAITTFYLTSYTPPPSPPPPPPPEDIAALPPEDAADVVEDLDPGDAADVVEDLDTETAADIFEEMNTVSAAKVVEQMNTVSAAKVVEQMNTVSAAKVVEQMNTVSAGKVVEQMTAVSAGKVVEQMTAVSAAKVVEQMTAVSAGKVVEQMTAVSAAKVVEQMTAVSAGKVVEQMNTTSAGKVVEQMNTTSAGKVMEQVQVDSAASIMVGMERNSSVNVLAKVNVSAASKIFEEIGHRSEDEAGIFLDAAVDTGNEDAFADILLDANENSTAASLLKSKPTSGGTLIEKMATKNLNAAAKRVEAAIKIKTRELDPEVREEMLAKAAAILEEVTVESLVDLFIEIVNLPDTPSTVAEVLEVMSLTKILDVVTAWIPTGDFESLTKVFDLLSVEYLTNIWMGMSSTERDAVLPHLSAETAATLPELTEFRVTELSVSPTEVQVNEYVSISVTVENVGIEVGDYIIRVKINGLTEVTETVSVAAGASTTVTFSVAKDEGGTYTVEADGRTDTFTVIAPEPPVPAEFVLSNLVLSPREVNPGEPVSVSVDIKNIGEESGSYTVELSLDDVIEETELVTLDGGESISVSFSLSSEDAGDHVVEVDGLSSSFTVTEPPVEPDYTWVYVLVAVLVLAAAGYYYWRRTQA